MKGPKIVNGKRVNPLTKLGRNEKIAYLARSQWTYEAIAKRFKITKQRVAQIVALYAPERLRGRRDD